MPYRQKEQRAFALASIDSWGESGLNQSGYCPRACIARSTFQYWRKRYDPTYSYRLAQKKTTSEQTQDGFTPVKIKNMNLQREFHCLSKEIGMTYENSVCIGCSSDLPSSELQKLICLKVY